MQKAQNGLTMTNRKLYHVWKTMQKRANGVFDHNRHCYENVEVCNEWAESFESFLSWAKENGYKEGLTIDRIDNTKGYYPDNCRFVDYFIQNQNKRKPKNNRSGVKGVCSHTNGYRAYLTRYGKTKNLGVFKTVEEARIARERAEKRYEATGTL